MQSWSALSFLFTQSDAKDQLTVDSFHTTSPHSTQQCASHVFSYNFFFPFPTIIPEVRFTSAEEQFIYVGVSEAILLSCSGGSKDGILKGRSVKYEYMAIPLFHTENSLVYSPLFWQITTGLNCTFNCNILVHEQPHYLDFI